MTPQELKNSILQLAIQGKLVEQRAEEGTGEEIYRQIQLEKQGLIKFGKIKKGKTLSEVTSVEIPFGVPDSWKWVRLGQVFTTIMGQSPDGESVVEGQSGIEFHQGKIYFSDVVIDKSPLSTKVPSKIAPANSLLLCVRAPVGKVNITDRDLCIGRGLSALVCHGGISVIFAFYWLQSLENEFIKKSTGATFKAISADVINTQPIPLPPLAEQKRIVAKIEELLPLIDRYEKAWSRLESFNKSFPVDMQKSILQMAIQGKLVEQRAEEGTGRDLYKRLMPYNKSFKPCKDELNLSSMNFDVPKSWKMIELNQLFDFVDYRGKTPTKINSGVFLITASNVKRAYMDYTRKEYISKEEYQGRQSRGLTQKGDLLFTTEAPMVNAALCDLDECSCGQRIITFKEYEKETALPALYMYFILSSQFQQQLLDNCTGTTAKGIKADKLKHFVIPLPPYAEQKRIVAKLEEILPLCESLENHYLDTLNKG